MSKLEDNDEVVLGGTTRKVFRFIYRQREPVGIREVQRGLDLSSPSVAQYHITKLLRGGLLREEGKGYVADKTVFENMVRIRRMVLPLQAAYASFFAAALVIMVSVLRPVQFTSLYFFAVSVVATALCVTMIESYKAARSWY